MNLLICQFVFILLASLNGRSVQQDDTLKSVLPFPLGAAVKADRLNRDAGYRNLLSREFNSITPENAMKFKTLHPTPQGYKWKDADQLVDFALRHNMRVHGHTLNWAKDKTYPAWLIHFKGDSAAWEALLKDHIQTVMRHFKGKVASWDVVNEAIDEKGKFKNTFWVKKLGVEYIARCFQYAHEADPDALLFYNDYGHEYRGKKLAAILNLVQELKKRKIPIHGLGMQMHTNVRISGKKIQEAIRQVAATGLKVHLSELEVSVKYRMPSAFTMTKELSDLQAQRYALIFKAYLSIPQSQQFGITTWNASDADSFRNAEVKNHDHPLLFDNNYLPKPAYKAVLNAVLDQKDKL